MKLTSLFAAVCVVAWSASAWAETKVEVKDTHLCCGQCVKAVQKVLESEGVKGDVSQDDSTIKFTAADDKAAQKVVDALAAAGFHGTVDNKNIKMPEARDVPSGKVASLTLKGIHNCCGQCNNTIKKTIKGIEGVESEDAKPKNDTIVIKGNFDAQKLVKALQDAGFHASVQK